MESVNLEHLSEQTQKDLFEKYKNGDQSAREKLIVHNLPLAYKCVLIYNNGKRDEDLISVAEIALIDAVDNFNLDLGVKFSTFAINCIKHKIFRQIRKDNTIKNNNAGYYCLDSADENLSSVSFFEILKDKTTEKQLDDLDYKHGLNLFTSHLRNELNGLDYQIFEELFLNTDYKITLQEIANKFNVSKQCVWQVKQKVKRILNSYVATENITPESFGL